MLHKFSVRANDGSLKLLKVIKNPITDHLPVGIKKLKMSFNGNKVVKCKDLITNVHEPIAIVIGAMAHGQVKADYTEDVLSISSYPLSAALTCTKVCSAFEEAWNIL